MLFVPVCPSVCSPAARSLTRQTFIISSAQTSKRLPFTVRQGDSNDTASRPRLPRAIAIERTPVRLELSTKPLTSARDAPHQPPGTTGEFVVSVAVRSVARSPAAAVNTRAAWRRLRAQLMSRARPECAQQARRPVDTGCCCLRVSTAKPISDLGLFDDRLPEVLAGSRACWLLNQPEPIDGRKIQRARVRAICRASANRRPQAQSAPDCATSTKQTRDEDATAHLMRSITHKRSSFPARSAPRGFARNKHRQANSFAKAGRRKFRPKLHPARKSAIRTVDSPGSM